MSTELCGHSSLNPSNRRKERFGDNAANSKQIKRSHSPETGEAGRSAVTAADIDPLLVSGGPLWGSPLPRGLAFIRSGGRALPVHSVSHDAAALLASRFWHGDWVHCVCRLTTVDHGSPISIACSSPATCHCKIRASLFPDFPPRILISHAPGVL